MTKETPPSRKAREIVVTSEKTEFFSSEEYASTLTDLKKSIQESQVKAITAANKELIVLYWVIGRTIVERQQKSGWGTNFIEKLAHDLQNSFPGIEGFSRSNIFRMRAFYLGYSKVAPAVRQFNDLENLRILSQIPWSHNVVLMEKLDDIEERCWYAHKAIEHGWSRNMLAMWIESGLHKREGKGVTNFQRTLPAPQSDMAQQTIKDPYIFDFLTLQEKHFEKDLEDGLVDHIQKFLLELGQGFAFMGRQYPLTVSGKQYYADLLFYHVKLKCYFVVRIEGDGIRPQGYRTAEFLSFSS